MNSNKKTKVIRIKDYLISYFIRLNIRIRNIWKSQKRNSYYHWCISFFIKVAIKILDKN